MRRVTVCILLTFLTGCSTKYLPITIKSECDDPIVGVYFQTKKQHGAYWGLGPPDDVFVFNLRPHDTVSLPFADGRRVDNPILTDLPNPDVIYLRKADGSAERCIFAYFASFDGYLVTCNPKSIEITVNHTTPDFGSQSVWALGDAKLTDAQMDSLRGLLLQAQEAGPKGPR
jgi:hypothetical protein